MADGITLNAGSGGVTLKTDDDGTYHWQVVKLAFGADNTQTEVGSISSNPLPVALSSTDNAVLDNIQTAVELIDNAISGAGFNITQFAGAAVPIGAGVEATALRVTLATDSTGVLSVDDNGGSLTVDGTVTANLSATDNAVLDQIQTNTANLTNCIVQDDSPFTPATGYLMMIGGEFDDAAPDSVDEGDAGNVRISANRNMYVQLRDAAGNERGLNIDASGELGVTNSGTFVTQEDGAALTALQLIDDSIFADDAAFTLASSKVTMSGAIRDDSLSTLTAIEGDAVPLRVSSTGALHVTGGGGGTEYTEDVATANPIVGTATMMERDDALSTLTPIEGDWASMRCSAEGALWVQEFNSDAILADTASMDTNLATVAGAVAGTEMQVDVVASLPAGTNAIGKLAANSGVDIGDVDVTSVVSGTGATNLGKAIDSAAGGTDTGVAMLAVRDDEQAAITPVDGDYTYLTTDKYGKLKVTLAPDATSVPKYAVISAASSGDNTIVAAAGAGIKIRVVAYSLVCAAATTTRFESGASGTALTGQMSFAANGGISAPYNPDGWFETADNTLLNLELSAANQVSGHLTYVEV